MLPGNPDGRVRASAVNHDDFLGDELCAVDCGRNVFFFVLGEDKDGQGIHFVLF